MSWTPHGEVDHIHTALLRYWLSETECQVEDQTCLLIVLALQQTQQTRREEATEEEEELNYSALPLLVTHLSTSTLAAKFDALPPIAHANKSNGRFNKAGHGNMVSNLVRSNTEAQEPQQQHG